MASQIKNVDYWERRSKEIEEQVFSDTKEFERRLDVVYRANIQDIDNQINSFLTKYVEQDGILTYGEAMKNMTKDEKNNARSILETLTSRYNQTKDPELLSRIKKLSATQVKTRLDGLKLQMEGQLAMLASESNDELEDFLSAVYEDVYLESTASYAEGLGVVNDFDTLNTAQIEAAVKYPYSGALFSENIWASTDKLSKSLRNTLLLGLGQGKSIDKLSKELKERLGALGVDKNSYTNYDIRRIVRTEAKFVQERAKSDANKKYGFNKYKIKVGVDERTCPRCGIFENKTYIEDERTIGVNAPPFHPQCRCTTVPFYDEVKRVKKEEEDALAELKAMKEKSRKEPPFGKDNNFYAIDEDIRQPHAPDKRDFDNDEDYQLAKKQYREDRKKYKELRNEYIEKNLARKPVFDDITSVKKWAKDIDIMIDDELLERIDLRAFNDIKPVVEELLEQYPALKMWDGEPFRLRYEPDSRTSFMSGTRGIWFNRTFDDYGDALSDGFDMIADKFNVYGDGHIRSLYRHEIGHTMESKMNELIFNDEWNKDGSLKIGGAQKKSKFTQKLVKLWKEEGCSEYALTNEVELFAEGFNAYTSGQQTPFAKKFGELLNEYIEDTRIVRREFKTDNLQKAFTKNISPIFTAKDAVTFTKKIDDKLQQAPSYIADVWNKFEESIDIGKMSSKNAYYSPNDGKLYLSKAGMKKDSNTHRAFEVFFHESAHLFDIKQNKYADFAHSVINSEYSKTLIEEGNAFIEKLGDDFLESKLDSLGFKTLAEAKANGITVSKSKKYELYTKFIDQFDMVDTSNLQDMIQATCGNDYSYLVGHSETYYNNADNIPIEAFAEMFSSEVANPKSLKLIKQVFPKSYEIFKDICKGMKYS